MIDSSQDRLRILVLAIGLSGGGSERVASIIANRLHSYGHQVAYACVYNGLRGYKLDDEVAQFDVYSQAGNRLKKYRERVSGLLRVVDAFGPDVALSFIANESVPVMLSGVPTVLTLRYDLTRVKHLSPAGIWRLFALSRAKAAVFQTSAVKSLFPRSIAAKSEVIANPLEVGSLPIWNPEEAGNAFITTGRLEQQKNHALLIDAFTRFHEDHPSYRLEVLGRGSLRPELERRIADARAQDYILLPGWCDDVHERMRHACAFALTSDHEGMSNSLLEALAMGMPVISTDHSPGSAREYIRDGENGLLVPVGDVEALRKALCRIADDREAAIRMGRAALDLRSKLDADTVCRKWEQVLLRCAR